MSNNYKYPTTYELKEILSRITNRKFLNDFAQSRGIFITNANQNLVADELAKIFYDESDLEIIRNEAYSDSYSHTLSGFIIKSKRKNFNLKTVYEKLRENGKAKLGTILNEVSKINDDDQFDFKSSYEYVKTKPGRIEFLQNEPNFFDFYFKDLGNNSWQIEIDSSKSTDTKELQSLFINNLSMDQHDLELINQDYLTSKATIEFFDTLAIKGLDKSEWNFIHIKHLTVKRGNDNEEEDELSNLNSEDTKEPTKQQLTGITHAILEGKNLREEPFVKECEKSGYKFAAMTYEFENKNTPFVISIKAEFKGRPKVFEVSITEVAEKTGIKLINMVSSLSSKDNRKIRSIFWNNAKAIYQTMKSSK